MLQMSQIDAPKWEEVYEEEDNFIETILDHVRNSNSFTCLGAPGTRKSGLYERSRMNLQR